MPVTRSLVERARRDLANLAGVLSEQLELPDQPDEESLTLARTYFEDGPGG